MGPPPVYDARMYTDALSFLEDERDTFRAYEALDALTDEQLDIPVAAAGGWSGRDLMGHITLAQEDALAIGQGAGDRGVEPHLGSHGGRVGRPGPGTSSTTRGSPASGRCRSTEVRARFRTVSGELRGYLTVVPESRWIKHATHQEYFFGELTEHYEEHEKELRAILEAVS